MDKKPRVNSKKVGNAFQKDLVDSAHFGLDIERLKDAGYTGENQACINCPHKQQKRFTPTNIADYIMFDGLSKEPKLIYMEAKSFLGKSFSFTNIKLKHLEKLVKKGNIPNVRSIIIMNFRDLTETYSVEAEDLYEYMMDQLNDPKGRKSVPYEWVKSKGVLVPCDIKISRYRYDLKAITRPYEEDF